MAGSQGLEMVKRERSERSMTATQDPWKWQWKVQYARCFNYPSSYLSKTSAATTTTNSSLSPLDRKRFQPIWLSSSQLSTVSLHPSADGSVCDSIITVNLQGTLIEEHFISKLQFVWPQVSCMSGFPTRGSVVVIAIYVDSSHEKQKFAMRFSGVSEVEEFITSVEDVLSNKIPKGPPPVDVSAISSESEFVPPYIPDISNVFNPIDDSTVPNNSSKEGQKDSEIQDTIAGSQSNLVEFPPSFSSLMSICSAELEQGEPTPALGAVTQDNDMKAQIAKYMQDASFLDMVSKVNEVITELGDDYAI